MKNIIINFPKINPVLIAIGNISINWYGIIYFTGFILSIWYGKNFINNTKYLKLNNKKIQTLIYNSFIGILVGSRIGYILFYNNEYILINILNSFKIWNGGMSFYGGLIGTIISIFFSARKIKKNFFEISDFLSIITPIGLGIGRIGNFINAELYGKVTTCAPFSILFPTSTLEDLIFIFQNQKYQEIFIKYKNLPRHPSQIYECILEGIILFLIINKYMNQYPSKGFISNIFLINYSLIRFLNEFFREPDIQIKLFYNFFTIGQIFSIITCTIGLLNIIILKNNQKKKNLY